MFKSINTIVLFIINKDIIYFSLTDLLPLFSSLLILAFVSYLVFGKTVSTMVCSSTGTKEVSTDQISSAVRNLPGREYLSKMESQKLILRGQFTKRWKLVSVSCWQSLHSGEVVKLGFRACCKAAVGM